MNIVATQKLTRQTPRKVRLVANSVRKLSLEKAIDQLSVIQRRSSLVILKTIKQAIANALNNHNLSFESLELKNILVTEGPSYKRFQAASRGRAHSILKRTSNIRVELTSATPVEVVTEPVIAASSDEAKVSEKKSETKKVAAKTTKPKQASPKTKLVKKEKTV